MIPFVPDLDIQPSAALDLEAGTASQGCGSDVRIIDETLPAQSFRANLQRLHEQGKLSMPPLSVSGDNIAVINQLNGLWISAVGAGSVNTVRTSLWKYLAATASFHSMPSFCIMWCVNLIGVQMHWQTGPSILDQIRDGIGVAFATFFKI